MRLVENEIFVCIQAKIICFNTFASMHKNPEKMKEIDGDAVEQRLQTLLKEGPNVFADSQESTMTLPEYYDPVKFRRGQRIFENNIFTMMIAKLSGLLLLLAIPSILVILKFTRQSGTPCAAFRRYASTVLHTCIWYKNSPDQDIEFFVSLKNVRKKHCIASRRSSEAGCGRISQLDMALTQFGFMGFTLLCAKRLGINATDDDLDGLLHFWRVIAHVLGTKERFNLCNGSIAQCKALCERLLEEVFLPHLAAKNKDFEEMSDVMLEGLWPINPFINKSAFKSFTIYLIISSLPNNNHSLSINHKSLPITSQILLNLQIFVHKYLLQVHYWWSNIFRAYFNHHMRLAIYLTEHFPFLAYYLFGRKESYYNIFSHVFLDDGNLSVK